MNKKTKMIAGATAALMYSLVMTGLVLYEGRTVGASDIVELNNGTVVIDNPKNDRPSRIIDVGPPEGDGPEPGPPANSTNGPDTTPPGWSRIP